MNWLPNTQYLETKARSHLEEPSKTNTPFHSRLDTLKNPCCTLAESFWKSTMFQVKYFLLVCKILFIKSINHFNNNNYVAMGYIPVGTTRDCRNICHSLSLQLVSYMSAVISGATKFCSNSVRDVSVNENFDLVLKAIVSSSLWN